MTHQKIARNNFGYFAPAFSWVKVALVLFVLPFVGVKGQKNIELVSQLSYDVSCANIWGYTAHDGTEYALVGTEAGTSIVSLANPANPVEVALVPDAFSFWHEIKTWRDYAYVTNEDGNGLTIIDLSGLPDNVQSYQWSGASDPMMPEPMVTGHALFIDEPQGIAFIFGTNVGVGGALLLDLNANPTNPPVIGIYDERYIHDGYARNDTLWAAEIYDGTLSAIDMSNPANLVVMAQWATPDNFAHNCWLSEDGKTLFTTDEVGGAVVAAYDVSNLLDVKEIDRVQSNPGTGVIPHNTYWHNGYLPTSYYCDGVVIFDASIPNMMVEVGNFDTAPNFPSSDNFNGCWGVYPYFSSGLIIASDIEEGLYVLQPTYVRACYVTGTVTNALTGEAIPNVNITIQSLNIFEQTGFDGSFGLGTADAGTYTVTVQLFGFETQTFTVNLTNGQVENLNIALQPIAPVAFTLHVFDAETGQPIPNALIQLSNLDYTLDFQANADGIFNTPSLSTGTYDILVGQWGYVNNGLDAEEINAANNSLSIALDPGYYDDFAFDFDWTVSGNAVTGMWERGEPIGTSSGGGGGTPMAPDLDVANDWGNQCYVTENNTSGNASDGDVDNGNTILSSPIFDLTNYINPKIYFSYWFRNAGGSGSPNDELTAVLDNGTSSVEVFSVGADNPNSTIWHQDSINVADFIAPSNTMQIRFETSDTPQAGHLVEAAIDLFHVTSSSPIIGIEPTPNTPNVLLAKVSPNPFSETTNITIQSNDVNKQAFLYVYDAFGKLVVQQTSTENSFTLHSKNMATGVYFYHILQDGAVANGKLMVR